MASKSKNFDLGKTALIKTAAELEETRKGQPGRPKNDKIIRNEEGGNSSQEGLPPEYTRFSAIVKVDNINALRDYAYTNRISIREAIDEMIEAFIDAYNADPNNEPLLDHRKAKGRAKK